MSESRTPFELVTDYLRGATVLREAVSGMDPDALRARPVPGKMSSLEVLCHIADSDQFMCDRMKRTIATDVPTLMGVESAAYPGPLHYEDRDPELDLRLLEVQRLQMGADLLRMDDSAWSRTAVHSENGTQTLLEILDHAVDHLESHVETIYEKRRALGL